MENSTIGTHLTVNEILRAHNALSAHADHLEHEAAALRARNAALVAALEAERRAHIRIREIIEQRRRSEMDTSAALFQIEHLVSVETIDAALREGN